MGKEKLAVVKYKDHQREQVVTVWEKAVLATHDFLRPADFGEIKALVSSLDFNDLQVYCLTDDETVLGFVGVAEGKIEMLFLRPESFGKGYGKRLLDFAVQELSAGKLDVNEQNQKALAFYTRQGFEVFERTETDDQGRPYPLLRMRRKERLKG